MINPVIGLSKDLSQGLLLDSQNMNGGVAMGGWLDPPVPTQRAVAAVSPMLLRVAGAAYCYYIAQNFLVKGSDKDKNIKLAAFTAGGAYAPVAASMSLLLYANLKKRGR